MKPRFAINILAPACVLWGLNIHDPIDIEKLCNISITSAKKEQIEWKFYIKENKTFY